MNGIVTEHLDARIFLDIRGPGGMARIAAGFGTGFGEFLILPEPFLAVLDAQKESVVEATLGDGTVVEFETCWIEVKWMGEWRNVFTYIGRGDAQIGMKLLEGCDLHVRVVAGGEVRVVPVP